VRAKRLGVFNGARDACRSGGYLHIAKDDAIATGRQFERVLPFADLQSR
jgi:hypothetical protein